MNRDEVDVQIAEQGNNTRVTKNEIAFFAKVCGAGCTTKSSGLALTSSMNKRSAVGGWAECAVYAVFYGLCLYNYLRALSNVAREEKRVECLCLSGCFCKVLSLDLVLCCLFFKCLQNFTLIIW